MTDDRGDTAGPARAEGEAAAQAEQTTLQYQEVQRRLQALDGHLADLERATAETRSALAVLEGLEGDAVESLVPVGAGLRLRARLDPAEPVLVAVGGGYHAELPREAARERLAGRLERTESAFRAASQEADRLADYAQQLAQQIMRSQSPHQS